MLLDLCFADSRKKLVGQGEEVAKEILYSGAAWKKMKEIIKAQGGNPNISVSSFKPAKFSFEFPSPKRGRISQVNNKQINIIAKILGSPNDKKASLYLKRHLEEKVDKNDILLVMYSQDRHSLKEAKDSLKNLPIYTIE